MLQNACNILSQFSSEPVSRATLTDLEIIRLDVEDFMYICQTNKSWYAVYESDFIDNLELVHKEIVEMLSHEFEVLNWLPVIPTDELIYALPNSYLRYAVLKLKPKFASDRKYDPLAYGNSR